MANILVERGTVDGHMYPTNHRNDLCLFLFIIVMCFSCQSPVQENIENSTTETHLHEWVENYLSDASKDNWAEGLKKYFANSPDQFIERHQKFRNAIQGYKPSIKHLVIEDNVVMAWLTVQGKHVGKYDNLIPGIDLTDIEPTNKQLQWEEVWYFEIVDGKFGEKSDFMSQDLTRVIQLGIQEIKTK